MFCLLYYVLYVYTKIVCTLLSCNTSRKIANVSENLWKCGCGVPAGMSKNRLTDGEVFIGSRVIAKMWIVLVFVEEKHSIVCWFMNTSYSVISCLLERFNNREWSCAELMTLIREISCCCCCDSPATRLPTSVVQVEEVCDRRRVVPQVLRCELRRVAWTVEQMLDGVWWSMALLSQKC